MIGASVGLSFLIIISLSSVLRVITPVPLVPISLIVPPALLPNLELLMRTMSGVPAWLSTTMTEAINFVNLAVTSARPVPMALNVTLAMPPSSESRLPHFAPV
jgi:hypothetical protein